MKSLNNPRKRLCVLLIVIAGLLPAMTSTVLSADDEVQRIDVTATEFALELSSTTLESGRAVELVLRNEGALAHNIKIQQLGLKSQTVQTGKTDTLSFQAPAPGEYQVVCTVPGHKQAGMTATLRVE